jgi:hypothetical protein
MSRQSCASGCLAANRKSKTAQRGKCQSANIQAFESAAATPSKRALLLSIQAADRLVFSKRATCFAAHFATPSETNGARLCKRKREGPADKRKRTKYAFAYFVLFAT